MRIAAIIGVLIWSGFFAGLSSCANDTVESNFSVPSSDPLPAATPLPMTIAEENFAREWKTKFDKMKSDILDSHEKWKQKNIKAYLFVAAKYVGGVSSPWNRNPVLIKVDNGRPVSLDVVDKTDVSSLARTDGFEEFDTIDKLFGYMLKELENGRMVRAKYDKKTGFPTWVLIDSSFGIHGSRSITVSKFARTD